MDEDLREKIALFRYGVISELVARPLAPGEKEALLSDIAAKEWAIPGTRRTRIGLTTARDWVSQYQALGFDGLKPCPRSDAGRPRHLPEAVQELLLQLRAERPRASVSSLIRALRQSGRVAPEVPLPRSTVYRFLAAHGSSRPETRSPQADAQAFTHPHVNDLWTSDVMHGPRLLVPARRGGAKTYLLAFLDDASRMVPYAAFYPAENAACFQEALRQALLRRGIPRRLYCDNGSTFRTQHLQVICATLNIALIHSRPYQPRGRGKVERFFRHVRSAFVPHLEETMLQDLAALNRVFWAWLEGEYHQTPHRGLDAQTPLDRFLDDQALVRAAPEDLEKLLRMKVRRKVGRDRTVRLQSRLYETPDGYASETVEVLFDPYDPSRPVHFRRLQETEEIPLKRLDPILNAALRRVPKEAPEPPTPPKTGISYLELIAQNFYDPHNTEEKT